MRILLVCLLTPMTLPAAAGWDAIGGAWERDGKRIKQTELAPAHAFYIYDGAVMDDFRASVEITLQDTPEHWMSAGLVFRWRDESNWSICYISASAADAKVQISRCADGRETYPPECACRYPIEPKRKYRLQLEVKGDRANCYLDDRLMLACPIGGEPEGRIGLLSFDSHVEFDRFDLEMINPRLSLHPFRNPLDPLGGKVTPPVRSYHDVLARVAEFVKSDKGQGGIRTDDGKPVPPYLFHAVIGADERLTYEASYPAFHHALFIKGFLNYYTYSGDEEFLRRARELADWNIAHSTPSDCMYANLPYSTAHKGKPGGFVDGEAIMTDKPAFMGEMYVRLWEATGDFKYLSAARKIADTLEKTQLPEGRWHFRVKPERGEVVEDYTSNAIFAVRLFDALETRAGATDYGDPKKRALLWLLQGPVRSGDWRNFYEDVGPGAGSVGNWDAIETARYLIEHQRESPAYLSTAEQIFRWICDRFLAYGAERGPGLLEQSVCMIPMQVHTGHWAQLAAELGLATRNKAYVDGAVSALNVTTANLGDDGRGPTNVFVSGGKHSVWYSLSFSPLMHIPEMMGVLPPLAPETEDHILRYSAQPRDVQYADGLVEYRTARPAEVMLKLSFEPKSVTCDGVELQRDGTGRGSWKWDPEQKLLTVSHPAGRVIVE